MSQSWDDVDSEANQESPNCRVNWSEKWKDYGQEPNWDHNWKPSQCPQANASCVMHTNHLLPHKVQWCASKPKCNKLQQFYQKLQRQLL